MKDNAQKLKQIEEQIHHLQSTIRSLESRIAALESATDYDSAQKPPPEHSQQEVTQVDEALSRFSSINLEQQIGEYWFGQLGIVILIIGLIFFISYAFSEFPPFWQALIGYGITGLIYGISRIKSDRFKLLSNLLLPGSLFLLYFVTLRMHFFRETPIVGNKTVALIFLLLVLALQCYVAIRHRSQFLATITIILGFTTALLSDTHHFALITIVLTSIMAAFFFANYHWQVLGIGSIIFAYLGFLLYLLNNPLLGKQISILPSHDWMLVYLVATLVVFALVSFRPGVKQYLNRPTRILLTTVNSSGFYLVSFLVSFQFFRQQLAMWNFIFFGILFVIAVAQWTIRRSKYSTSFYASFSYIALTVAILTATQPPELYLWLAWQSALVIGTAIWFHSGIIIWANMGIYSIVFAVYLITGDYSGLVNFNFVIVAILSERLLQYTRTRLTGVPRFFQYLYMFTGFFMLLFGLSLSLPGPYISVAWFVASAAVWVGGYKFELAGYRYMGIGCVLLTVGRIFLIDLASLELIYRVISFLVVGAGLLLVGILYTRRR